MAIMKFAGPVFTLVMFVVSVLGCLWFALSAHVLGGVVTMGLMAAGAGWLVFSKDVPGFWKPLFASKK